MPSSSAAPVAWQVSWVRAWRAAIAVAALYALTRQAVLGGASLAASRDPAHVLCQQDAGSSEGPLKALPSYGHPDCCLVAHNHGRRRAPVYAGPNVEWSPEAYFADNANTLTVPSYALLNFRTGYDIGQKWSGYLQARNLFDRRYVSSVAIAGGANFPRKSSTRTPAGRTTADCGTGGDEAAELHSLTIVAPDRRPDASLHDRSHSRSGSTVMAAKYAARRFAASKSSHSMFTCPGQTRSSCRS